MRQSKVANWVLACAVGPAERQVVLGDLAEEFATRRCETSNVSATAWYWMQIARSIPWLLCSPVRQNGWVPTIGVAVAACLAQAGVELAIAALLVGRIPATVLVLLSLGVVSCLANRYRAGAGAIVSFVTLMSVLARGFPDGVPHALVAMCAPSASLAGTALAVNTERASKAV